MVKGNEMYYNALGLLGESLQIEDHLFDIIESMVCQVYGFLKEPNVNTFDMKSVAGRNFLSLLKFHQQKTSYINMLNASTTKYLCRTAY